MRPRPVPVRAVAHADLAWAAAAAALAFAAYVRTLAPGLVADVDSAMFQFIGRVLGVAHNPGYPLYVLLTHPFSYLPVGTLAYRINLFSALMGAVTVAWVFLIARRLGCRRLVSLAVALGLAFGRIFWSQAVVAEVYTLHAAIVASVLLLLLVWEETRRPAAWFAAIALFAAGLGNHTTIVGFAPGIALFGLLVDRNFVLRARTLVLSSLILMAGLAQYAFVLVRSLQPDAYVESRATTLAGLADVMLAGQFRERLFAFGWRDVLFERMPSLGSLLLDELTPVGLVLAAAGVVWLVRRRVADATLLLSGCALVFVFALNYSVIDTPVFLIPSVLVLWVAAGAGAERIILAAGAHRAVAAASSAAALALPLWLLAVNFSHNDRSGDVHAAIQFDRLFEALPDRSALVSEDFIVDRMVMYELLGRRAAGARHIELVPSDPDAVRSRLSRGFTVYGSRKAARALRHESIDVAFNALRLTAGPLDERLARLPEGAIVAVAVPARFARAFAGTGRASFLDVGGPGAIAPVAANVAIVGVRGAPGGAVVRTSSLDVDVAIGAGSAIGDTSSNTSAAIRARAGGTQAAIWYAGREVLRTSDGVGVAIWNANGRLDQTAVLVPADDFRAPLHSASLPFFAVRGEAAEQSIGAAGWTDVHASVATGSTTVRIPRNATVVLYVADDRPLAPRAFEWSQRARVDVLPVEGNGRETLRAIAAEAGAAAIGIDRDAYVYRIEMETFASGTAVTLAFGGVPLHAIARLISSRGEDRATAFAVDTRGLLHAPDSHTEVLLMGRDEQAQLTGHGWSAVEADEAGPYRRMIADESRVVLPTSRSRVRRLRLQARHHPGDDEAAIFVRLDGRELPSQPLREGWQTYEWELPDGTIHAGANEAAIVVLRGGAAAGERGRSTGPAVARLELIHDVP